MQIYTIGHSTHTLERFVALLSQHQITQLVDIRHYPGSRHCPWFNVEPLQDGLFAAGISYTHIQSLGGRRPQIVAGSGNEGWRVKAFRGYADYARFSSAFLAGLASLEQIARQGRTAYMCAEYTYLRCHRRILSDHLKVRGWEVQHITSSGALEPHVMTPFARLDRLGLVYPVLQ